VDYRLGVHQTGRHAQNGSRGSRHGGLRQQHRAETAERQARRQEQTDLRPPLDFPELPGAEQHVRTFWCRR
jgi:hypothetical protein